MSKQLLKFDQASHQAATGSGCHLPGTSSCAASTKAWWKPASCLTDSEKLTASSMSVQRREIQRNIVIGEETKYILVNIWRDIYIYIYISISFKRYNITTLRNSTLGCLRLNSILFQSACRMNPSYLEVQSQQQRRHDADCQGQYIGSHATACNGKKQIKTEPVYCKGPKARSLYSS